MGNGAMATRKEAIGDEQVQTIRAAVLRRRGGPLSIETLEMDGPRDDEVLVRITASGICHTYQDTHANTHQNAHASGSLCHARNIHAGCAEQPHRAGTICPPDFAKLEEQFNQSERRAH